MQASEVPISELAAAFAAYVESRDESFEWASIEIIDLSISGPWDRLWELVQALALLPNEPTNLALATMAAGPLEDLLAHAGPDYISQVEQFCAAVPRAARMLTGVWRSSIEPDVWARVVSFCRNVPDPVDGVYRY